VKRSNRGYLWRSQRVPPMVKHFLNPPNWFTSAGLFCGFYAIVLAAGNPGDPAVFYKAGLMIVFAGVFDMLDGGVARLTKTGSDFGIQLDSLSDIVCFGLAPAVLVYSWGLAELGVPGLAAAFFFLVCGAFRLARFNVGADGTKPLQSEGLTITMAGGTLASMVMVHAALGKTFVAHPGNVIWITLGFSLLMVSRVPFRTLKAFGLSPLALASLTVTLGSGVALAVIYRDIAFWICVVGFVYALSGPFEAVVFARGRRAAGHGILVDIDDDE